MSIRELGMTVFGLLCGSILFGRALPKWIKGIDVTEVSNDHNPGTANAMKYAGVPVGILCLLGDLLKGALPVYVAVVIYYHQALKVKKKAMLQLF